MNKQAKIKYFNCYNSAGSKPFWINCKPYFSNKYNRANTEILIMFWIKITNLIFKNEETAKTFNGYFSAIVDNFNFHHWEDKTSPTLSTSDKTNDIIKNYEKHPSNCKIKAKYRGISSFPFHPVSVEDHSGS